ncbi:MAG TPA: asparagine synthase-related protein, partial [Gemmatimonadaceae bacterium]|nr:asparagine synthase-related protein [Gemmatimonadaceae bacterium]
LPISRSHPVGDSGREDEAIQAICDFWSVSPNWVDAQAVPLFDGLRNRDRWSSESFAQPFEGLARALAEASRSLGASVALDGYGGDFLFQVSRVYLADMVSLGRIGRALGEWRGMDGGKEGMQGFFRYGIQPLLPSWAKRAPAGRLLRGSMERSTPPWVNTSFEREHSLADRFPALGPDAQSGRTAVDREAQFYLTNQFFARINARMFGFAKEQGVELRSPLLDSRVVRFALSRPREERNNRGDNKRLLRASMKSLLPDSVLAPRRGKAGTLTSYFAQHMRSEGLRRLSQILPARELATLGVVDSKKLATAIEQYRSLGSRYPHIEPLFCTLQAETWLRARDAATIESGPTRKQVGSA